MKFWYENVCVRFGGVMLGLLLRLLDFDFFGFFDLVE